MCVFPTGGALSAKPPTSRRRMAGRITISQSRPELYAGGEKSRSHGTRAAGGSAEGRWRRRGGEGPSSSPRRRGGGRRGRDVTGAEGTAEYYVSALYIKASTSLTCRLRARPGHIPFDHPGTTRASEAPIPGTDIAQALSPWRHVTGSDACPGRMARAG